jgi:hypothetical protein
MSDNPFDLISMDTGLCIAGAIAFLVIWSIGSMRHGTLIVKQWAEENGLKLISIKQRSFVPYLTPGKGLFFRIKVVDASGLTKEGWLRFPEWSPGKKNVLVDWDSRS